MPIPPHKCVIARGFCEPDDGVHVIAVLGVPGVSKHMLRPFLILSTRPAILYGCKRFDLE